MKQMISRIVRSKTTLKFVSVGLAFLCWLMVTTADTSSATRDVKEVPVNISLQETALSQLGLNIIDMDIKTVTATVRGDRVTVGQLEPEQLTATVQLASSYTEAGTYDLLVVPAATTTSVVGVQNKSYEIVGYKPETIRVRLDRIESKTFPVEVEYKGTIEVAPGFIRETKELVTPSEVRVTGPMTELAKIDRCVVELESNEVLERTFVDSDLPVKLLDLEGEEIDTKSRHLAVDQPLAQVVINVLKEKDLPLSIEFLNLPRNFPKQQLTYSLSNYEIAISGPVDTVSRYKELLVGFVDINQLGPDNNTFIFDIMLPNGFTSLDNVRTVTVTFDSTNWAAETFTVEDIQILNKPENVDVDLITKQVYNVMMVGDKDVLATLSAEDLVAEIDLANKRELTLGQYQYPVKISAPAKGLVWAHGEYSVVIQVLPPGEGSSVKASQE